MIQSRRQFLCRTTGTVAGAFIANDLFAQPFGGNWYKTADEILDDVTDNSLIKELAHVALEAAKGGGASFADIRFARYKYLSFRVSSGRRSPVMSAPDLSSGVSYGIRAIVNGGWGFASASTVTADGVTATALKAIARARANKPFVPRTLELAPAPVVTDGVWATPIEIDPFTVPVGEQADLVMAAVARGMTEANSKANVSIATRVEWYQSDRLFASTEGSVISQRICGMSSEAQASAQDTSDRFNSAGAVVKTLPPGGGYGYEVLQNANLGDGLADAVNESVRALYHPKESAEIGRYSVVFSPEAIVRPLIDSLANATQLDTALGFDSDTTYAMPPEEILGKYKVGSSLLTLTGDRSRPYAGGTVGWDEEGIKPDEYTFIKEGVIADYHSTRETAARLGNWCRVNGREVRSHGCATRTGSMVPIHQIPNLTMRPGATAVSAEDLIKDVKRGYYIDSTGAGGIDQQHINGEYLGKSVRKIENGKLGKYVADFAFQFNTAKLWQGLDAIGGSGSEVLIHTGADLPGPNRTSFIGVSAVPTRFREVNVVNVGRTL